MYIMFLTVAIGGQLIFAWVGVSFENSDGGGSNFFQHGGSFTK